MAQRGGSWVVMVVVGRLIGYWSIRWLCYRGFGGVLGQLREKASWVGSSGGWSVSLAEVGAVMGVGLEGVATVGICGWLGLLSWVSVEKETTVMGFIWVICWLGMCGQKGDLMVVGEREVDDGGRFNGKSKEGG
ncbi:hypothetical protein Peur_074574 [Populus x canadensis]